MCRYSCKQVQAAGVDHELCFQDHAEENQLEYEKVNPHYGTVPVFPQQLDPNNISAASA